MSVSRRILLSRAAAWAAAQWAAAKGVAAASTPKPRPRFSSDPFALGVASGDPGQESMTIWTRLTGPGLAPLVDPVRVRWEIAENETFTRIVAHGEAVAAAPAAHAVHIDVTGLEAGRAYFYRFHASDAPSRTGRFRTLPRRTERFRIALTACQHWEQGFFAAYVDAVGHDPELILQVGDYIYEKSFGAGPDVRRFPAADPVSLQDYRARHALYKSDEHLQAAHAAAAWCVVPDDHEVENDYAGSFSPLTDSETFLRRRANAYQAYLEHMPVSRSRMTPSGPRFHGKINIGDLANLYLLDTRQHRSQQAGAPDARAKSSLMEKITADASASNRTMLGVEQEAWLVRELGGSQPPWTILAQQTLFTPLEIRRPEGTMIWSDLWDGYAASREIIMEALAAETVTSALILSGDVHSFWRNTIEHAGRHVADEFVTSCLASRNAPAELLETARADNPHVTFLDNAHAGYTLVDLGRERADIEFRAVRRLTDPASDAFSLHGFSVERHPR